MHTIKIIQIAGSKNEGEIFFSNSFCDSYNLCREHLRGKPCITCKAKGASRKRNGTEEDFDALYKRLNSGAGAP